ncbi:MAG: hypothetical protein ACFFDT_34315 [Candidatus Hodarchaeota archaeon]
MNSRQKLEKEEEHNIVSEIIEEETTISRIRRIIRPGSRTSQNKSADNGLLQGKSFQVYWYLLEHGSTGIREIHRALNFSSPGLVSYQIKKLIKAGLVTKDEKTEKYFVSREVKTGLLKFYVKIGKTLIPRFSIYLMGFLFGFLSFFFSAFLWGDQFITNPGSLILLIFLIFGSMAFIYESMKLGQLKPN